MLRRDWGKMTDKECRDDLNRRYNDAQAWVPGMPEMPQMPDALTKLMATPRQMKVNVGGQNVSEQNG